MHEKAGAYEELRAGVPARWQMRSTVPQIYGPSGDEQ